MQRGPSHIVTGIGEGIGVQQHGEHVFASKLDGKMHGRVATVVVVGADVRISTGGKENLENTGLVVDCGEMHRGETVWVLPVVVAVVVDNNPGER